MMVRTLCFLLFAQSSLVLAQSKSDMLERLNNRYDNFFERRAVNERLDRARLSGSKDIKQTRQMEFEMRERARKRYVLNRKPPQDLTASYQAHLRQMEKEKKAYLEMQRGHSRIRAEVEAIQKRGKKIPPVLEYELQDAL